MEGAAQANGKDKILLTYSGGQDGLFVLHTEFLHDQPLERGVVDEVLADAIPDARVPVDVLPGQLSSARLPFRLVHAKAESTGLTSSFVSSGRCLERASPPEKH